MGYLLGHQECLEVLEISAHGHTLLFTLHKGCQSGRNGHALSSNILHHTLELGRMCRLQEESYFILAQAFLQGTIATSTMRIQLIPCLMQTRAEGGGYLSITVCGSGNILAYGLHRMSVEIQDTSEVAGIATSIALAMVCRLAIGAYSPVCRYL